jgi:hypothetical protein
VSLNSEQDIKPLPPVVSSIAYFNKTKNPADQAIFPIEEVESAKYEEKSVKPVRTVEQAKMPYD